jgi:hypothetical protein
MDKKNRLIPVLIFLPVSFGIFGAAYLGGWGRQNGPRGTVFIVRLPETKN